MTFPQGWEGPNQKKKKKTSLGEVWIFSGSTQSNLATEGLEALLLVLYTKQNCFKVKLASSWKLIREIMKFKTKINTASKYQNKKCRIKGATYITKFVMCSKSQNFVVKDMGVGAWENGGGRVTGGGDKEGVKQDSQGGGSWEKLRTILQ